jgi:predicted phosphodiesterase
MKIAVLSDVHGNALALEAVMSDLRKELPDLVIDLGDRASGPLWPKETMMLFADLQPKGVRGNHDRQVATLPVERMGPSDRYAAERVSPEHRKLLGELPIHLHPLPGVVAFHASPGDDARYLTERIEMDRLVHRQTHDIEADLQDTREASLVLCGHSHRPFMARLPSGGVIINPGSVGCPAYEDDNPPHVSEVGSPHARYAVIRMSGGTVAGVAMKALTYPWEEAAKQADRNDRADWAHGLRTGHARPTNP